jgi:hypothetical protein
MKMAFRHACLMTFLCVSVLQVSGQNVPRIGFVYPAGGRQGSTVQLVLGGQFLDGVTNVIFSGSGVHGKVVEHIKPLTQKQLTLFRDQLKELEQKKKTASPGTWTTTDQKQVDELKKKLANPPNRANPAISETVKVTVQIDANAELGERDIRLETVLGLTNPRVFCVGQLPEFSREPAESIRERDPNKRVANRDRKNPFETRVQLPTVVNGQILPGTEDAYRFFMHKGAHLVIAVNARELIPYLPDAVPGWFQASITLTDSSGRELTYADHYTYHPDPLLHYVIPADGDYCLSIRDSIYRGREDFVYRISIGELPYIANLFPRGGPVGTNLSIQLSGWNLPETNVIVNTREMGTGIHNYSVSSNGLISNMAPLAVDDLPEVVQTTTNNAANIIQEVGLPVIVNGFITHAGSWNGYRFKGKAGQSVIAEVVARRVDSPMDSVLRLVDSQGKQLAFNDDCEDKASGLDTHHADSRVALTLPTDGTYTALVGDAQQHFGRDFSYRLRLSEPRPDFELRMVPSSINLRPGAIIPVTIYALRKDGFNEDIELVLKEAPAGFELHGAWVPAGTDKIQATLTASAEELTTPAKITIEGRSRIQGKTVIHPAIPAEDMMQAFIYRHLVPSREMAVASINRSNGRNRPLGLIKDEVIKLSPGQESVVHFKTPGKLAERGGIDLKEAPEGVTVSKIESEPGGTKVILACNAKLKSGIKGNLIFNYFPDKATAGRSGQRPNGACLPAIRFETTSKGLQQSP